MMDKALQLTVTEVSAEEKPNNFPMKPVVRVINIEPMVIVEVDSVSEKMFCCHIVKLCQTLFQ